ncbi:hypothetical protein GCM10017600_82740 [Streptosporangium carneum]|uniref:Major facilitator superfamily (MFS) profile domain-containing protein n=2 Tax=Streptosporangium carneum TaxID=47481 RepID=A0A9W6MI17_9ACTN|nr:hypothetical protein GCM10017600_82740 [Streptosporangium carneum]
MKTSLDRPRLERRPLPRTVRVLAPVIGLSNFGDGLAITALMLEFHDRHGGGAAMAALFMALSVPGVLLAGLAGRVADRVAVRRVVVLAGVVLVLVCATMAYVTSIVLILSLLSVLAGIMALVMPTMAKAVTDASPGDLLSRGQARMSMMGSLGFLLGPAAGGVLMETVGLRPILLMDAASFAALPLAALLLPRGGEDPAGTSSAGPGGAPSASGLLPGLRAIAAHPALLRTVGLGIVLTVGLQAVNVVEIFFVRDDLGGGAGIFGLLTMVWSAGQIVGAWLAGDFLMERNPVPTAFFTTFTVAVVTLSTVVISDIPPFFVLLLLGGLALGGFNVARQTLLARSVDPAGRGSAFAAHTALLNTATTVALLVGGVVSVFVAPRTVYGIVGMVTLVSVLVAGTRHRTFRDRPAPEGGGHGRADARSGEGEDDADDGAHRDDVDQRLQAPRQGT